MTELGAEVSVEQEGVAEAASKRRIWKPTLAQAGFIMSVTLALINAYYAFRGSVMVVQPTRQVIVYRDGEGVHSVLTLAVRSEMINTADSAHGDVVMGSNLELGRDSPKFEYSSEIKPVFTSGPQSAEACPADTRCVTLTGLRAIEQDERILSIPGGQVLGTTLAYPLTEWNCAGSAAACARFRDFPTALASLAGKPLTVTMNLKFFADGSRQLKCRAKAIDVRYLEAHGWMTMSCNETSVTGDPLI